MEIERPAGSPPQEAVGAPGRERVWELDFARGLIILLMIVNHVGMDVNDYFYLHIVDFQHGILHVVNYLFMVFMVVAGISSTYSRSNVKRGLKLLLFALLITAVTWRLVPGEFIKFGILHFFAVCMIAWPIYRKWDWRVLLAVAAAMIGLGVWFGTLTMPESLYFLFPFGLTSPSFVSGDYFPIFPWMGVYLVGVALGRTVYRERRSLLKKPPKANFVNFVGRHSLVFYILHQPVALGILWVIARIFHLPFAL